MSDINNFANDTIIEFVDAFHACVRVVLQGKHGDSWLEKGVRRHFKPDYFDRTLKMLTSSMRVVDIERSGEELHGVEHLGTIIVGNWDLFKGSLDNRARTEVYLSEIAEMRHNLSHRRRRHILRRRELLRLVENCRMLLRALGSDSATRFEALADSLSQGGSPWGAELAGSLPSPHEIVSDFVGRPDELQRLSEWLLGTSPQILVFGYGGAGKSATAFQFARQVQESGLEGLQAVCWASAKKLEFVEGAERQRHADFFDVNSFARSVLATMYGDTSPSANAQTLLRELTQTPSLVVIDDFDTVLHNEELAEFLLFTLRQTHSRFVFTSRNKVPGLPTVEMLGFTDSEVREFVKKRATEYQLDYRQCEQRIDSMAKVTGAFPLFLDDLLRYSRLVGVDKALVEWQQRRGDAAREYALRRQLEQLGGIAQDTLMAICVASRPLTALEVATVAGSADDDVEKSLMDLEAWRLIDRVVADDSEVPAFDVNDNTRRLVPKTYKDDERIGRFTTAFKAYSGQRLPPAMQKAIASVISVARSMVMRDDMAGAIATISEAMRGDLRQSADLHGALGWICSRHPADRAADARAAFQKAHELGSRNRDTYFHWARMEVELAEESDLAIGDEERLYAWRRVWEAAALGVKRCGDSRGLCQIASYGHCRCARLREHLKQFAAAQGDYGESRKWAERALAAPSAGLGDPSRDVVYRSLALALEGCGDVPAIAGVIKEWGKVDPNSNYLASERSRLGRKFAGLDDMLSE